MTSGSGNLGRGRAVARVGDESGQALILALGGAFAILAGAVALVAIAGAVTGKGRVQRAADLVAISAARSMRDDLPRLLSPPTLPGGLPNPSHLDKPAYLARAQVAAVAAGRANGVGSARLRIAFPDAASFAPVRARVAVVARLEGEAAQRVEASAEAEAAAPATAAGGMPTTASGGGYGGPLVYRDGKGMRPDVAAAYDRMAAAARADGITLVVVSGFRSDAEQARLFAEHPDPKWVAPPGHSLHRCATELDLGPDSAYVWIAANAARFGFVQRYSWEAWHFGFDAGPPPCSEAGDSVSEQRGGRRGVGRSGALPSLRPRPVPRADPARRGPLERLRRPARRPGDGRVELRSQRRLPRRRPGHRPVHARHRRELRPAQPLRPRRSDRGRGSSDARTSSVQLGSPRTRPSRLQRRPRSRRTVPLHPRPTPRPRPTSPGSSPCSAGPGALLAPQFEVRLVA